MKIPWTKEDIIGLVVSAAVSCAVSIAVTWWLRLRGGEEDEALP